jgi:hypothetical protein
VAEDDDSDVYRTQDRELMCLLKQTTFPFQKRPGEGSKMTLVFCFHGSASARTYTERLRSSLIALISIFLRPMRKVVPRYYTGTRRVVK